MNLHLLASQPMMILDFQTACQLRDGRDWRTAKGDLLQPRSCLPDKVAKAAVKCQDTNSSNRNNW